jgi:hypothetical protein
MMAPTDSLTFVAAGAVETEPLLVPRADALALLGWLGLPALVFGAFTASDVRARCMRRLWNERRNESHLRPLVERLRAIADASPDGFVLLG